MFMDSQVKMFLAAAAATYLSTKHCLELQGRMASILKFGINQFCCAFSFHAWKQKVSFLALILYFKLWFYSLHALKQRVGLLIKFHNALFLFCSLLWTLHPHFLVLVLLLILLLHTHTFCLFSSHPGGVWGCRSIWKPSHRKKLMGFSFGAICPKHAGSLHLDACVYVCDCQGQRVCLYLFTCQWPWVVKRNVCGDAL